MQTSLNDKTLGVIGAGNMGQSILTGLIEASDVPAKILICDHHPERLKAFQEKGPVHFIDAMTKVAEQSDILLLAVKPQSMNDVFHTIHTHLSHKPLIISVAAGLTSPQMLKALDVDANYPLVRVMPNTPSSIQKGISGLYTALNNDEIKGLAENVMQSTGTCLWIEDETHMDIVTALSGSGPAYFFYIIEAMVQGAVALGLPQTQAKTLALETGLGALEMAKLSEDSLSTLRKRVTSKGGTTAAGLNVFEDKKMASIIHQALKAAMLRGQTLSQEMNPPKN